MPVPADDTPDTPDSAEAAAFADALHHIADGLAPADRHALTAAGHARGRSLRRRRTAAVTAGVAVLALAGGGGLLAATSGNGTGHAAANGTGVAAPRFPSDAQLTAATRAPQSFTARQVENLLVSLLPHGKISGRDGRGTDDTAPYAQVVFDDGHGPAEISVVVQARSGAPADCGAARAAHDYCRQTTVPGGTLTVWKGYEYPDHRADTREWMAEFHRKDGALVSVTEWNAPAEKDAPVSRPTPPLSTSRLAAIATAPVWAKVIAAVPPGTK
ncbi:hypothetical protein [Streptomyces sp. NPDC087270]|uniref:hypothetical protein n=1 Tax=Streptomyces sp. NPDC087270 TaxID=3365774 RepID=UPI00381F4A71